jgi:hypothetical protein
MMTIWVTQGQKGEKHTEHSQAQLWVASLGLE